MPKRRSTTSIMYQLYIDFSEKITYVSKESQPLTGLWLIVSYNFSIKMFRWLISKVTVFRMNTNKKKRLGIQ